MYYFITTTGRADIVADVHEGLEEELVRLLKDHMFHILNVTEIPEEVVDEFRWHSMYYLEVYRDEYDEIQHRARFYA